MNNIREIRPQRAQPNERLIESLRRHLRAAEAGDLISMAFVGRTAQGDMATEVVLSESPEVFALVGAVTYLQNRMVCDLIQRPR